MSQKKPLEGVRVADFTWAWAGPTCTMQLAHLGADVIKVESSTRLDTVRGLPPFWQDVRNPNRSGYFNQYSQGKRSLALNLKHPSGVVAAKDLIRGADVVVDNFSAGVMDRMGLGYDALRAIRPDIIQISLSAHGQTGPFAGYIAYGPTQVPMIGLASLTGYAGGGPREVGLSYGDPNGGINAALAVLAALWHRNQTGEGQFIDMSQWEAALPLVVEGLLTYQMTGEQPARMGNRDQFEAPQGVFRCMGEQQWVAVSCWSDSEWQALAAAIGRHDLAADADLCTREGRKAREPDLEAAIRAWTSGRTRESAEAELRAAGVPAHEVYTTADVANDPVLAEREFWVLLPHPECDGARHGGIPWRFSGTPLAIRSAAPCLGWHTEEVLREVIGMSDTDISAMREAGTLE
jgi:benzylsuccinate CoA-transferase BbsF subunit